MLNQENRGTVETVVDGAIRRSIIPRMNSWVITIAILFCYFTGNAQTHFQPVPSTGLPYTIVVTNATINGVTIVPGSEIAVFDDTLCVGAVVYQDTFPVTVTAWQASSAYGLAGFTPGNSMLFKMYTQNPLGFWAEIVAGSVLETGNGFFGDGVYTAVSLITSSIAFSQRNSIPESCLFKAYPNPFNAEITFIIDIPTNRSQTELQIYNLLGRKIFSTIVSPDRSGRIIFRWNGHDRNGRVLPTGNYFVKISNGFYTKQQVITYQK